MPSKKSKNYSKQKISFKRSSSSSSSEESSEEHRPVKKYTDLKRKKSQKESSDDDKKPRKGNLKTSSSFKSQPPKQSRVTFSNLIVAIIEDGQRNPVKKTSHMKQKELYLRENKWGNLTNGLLVFFEFEVEDDTVVLCIGFQNTRAKVNTKNPLASVIKLNAKAKENLASLEKKVGQKLEILDKTNYSLLYNPSQRKKVVHLVCDNESSESSSEEESDRYGSIIDSSLEETETSKEVELPKETEKKKGWLETMTGMTSLPKFKFW